jgi:predicted deacylase
MPPALLASERDEFWFYHVLRLVPLRDTAIALTPASADSAGWTAVTATRAGRPTVTLQFDAAHRVRTAAATITGADGRAARQVLQLDGTIEAGGVRWFRTMAITHDGAPFFTLTIGEFAVDRVLDRRRLAP